MILPNVIYLRHPIVNNNNNENMGLDVPYGQMLRMPLRTCVLVFKVIKENC